LAGAGFDFLKIEGVSDSSRPGDTIFLTARDSTALEFDRQLFTLDSGYVKRTLGALTIQNSTPVHALLALNFAGRLDTGFSLPFHQSSVQTIKGVYSVLFDSACPLLPVTVKNTCARASMKSLSVWISDNDVEVTSGPITALSPGDSAVILMPIAGKSLDSTIVIGVDGMVSVGEGTFAAEEGIDIVIPFDGMTIGRAVVIDSLLRLSERYEQPVGLSDTFRIDYIDLDTGIVDYAIRSTTPVNLLISGAILNAWDMLLCKERNITEGSMIAALTTASDSADTTLYRGGITIDTLGRHGETENRGRFTFGPARLFARWNPVIGRSEVDYRFSVSLLPVGRRVTLDKNDRFEADLKPVRFPFVALNGTFQYPLRQSGDPVGFSTEMPWKKSITDSLRNKLAFTSVVAPIELRLNASCSTRIDSARLDIKIAEPETSAAPACTTSIALSDLADNATRTLNVEFSDIINRFPDSLIFSCGYMFPAGTRLFLANERDARGGYRNDLRLRANVTFGLRIPLDWKLKDTAVVILEDSRVDLDSSLKKFDVLEDLEISLAIRIDNRTNFSGILYALAAADADSQALLALREDQIEPARCATPGGDKFINLLGDHGLLLPSRRTKDGPAAEGGFAGDDTAMRDVSIVALSASSVEGILAARKIHIRWKLVLPAKSSDALTNGDSFTVESSFRIQGVMTAHTLAGGWK
jgi:hypothetical protein